MEKKIKRLRGSIVEYLIIISLAEDRIRELLTELIFLEKEEGNEEG